LGYATGWLSIGREYQHHNTALLTTERCGLRAAGKAPVSPVEDMGQRSADHSGIAPRIWIVRKPRREGFFMP